MYNLLIFRELLRGHLMYPGKGSIQEVMGLPPRLRAKYTVLFLMQGKQALNLCLYQVIHKGTTKLPLSKHINKTKLSWNKDGIIHGVRYQDGNLVVQFPGWYFIICQLQFLVKCPEHSVDLKLELLINKDVKKQTLVTVCESGAQTKNIYQNLSQFLLEHLQVNTTISVKVDKFQYVDTNTFPLENVFSIFLYSSSD
ncbi:Tumor necrosis factor ligand superfamily member 8 [Camelus dromedarius]|uniref:Tumor necrosis factor ligand superfamily member 8 n=1 Tax=Camelus dromedarius TaxID=9838 RepID=A0A5N4EB02_CAMDR|nr:Tumor necrosis factor ligand superfamily member 8 [Camelus dromedarius]